MYNLFSFIVCTYSTLNRPKFLNTPILVLMSSALRCRCHKTYSGRPTRVRVCWSLRAPAPRVACIWDAWKGRAARRSPRAEAASSSRVRRVCRLWSVRNAQPHSSKSTPPAAGPSTWAHRRTRAASEHPADSDASVLNICTGCWNNWLPDLIFYISFK